MRRVLRAVAFLSLFSISICRAEDRLASGFQNPPDSAKPHTWWHWMNGNVTKEGITADLEAMKRVGVGGAEIFVVDEGIPAGDAKFLTPKFMELFKHACSEADRLGLELCMHNCAGWSSSGGPWNTPEHAMQFVTTSETHIKGPAQFTDVLKQPDTKLDFYKDIAVLAFHSSPGETGSMKDRHPKITSSVSDLDGAKLIDGDIDTAVVLPKPTNDKPQYVQLELDKPLDVRSIAITPGKLMLGCGGEVQTSEDGSEFRTLRQFNMPRNLSRPLYVAMEKPVSSRFFRIVFNKPGARTQNVPIAEIDLTPRAVVDDVQNKAGYQVWFGDTESDSQSTDLAIQRDQMVDLTGKLGTDGKLTWDVPEGEWTILRIGYTPTGVTNHPAPPEATGPECDKFSTEALDAHWNGYVQKMLDEIGPLAGKSMADVLIDSYETGGQNWTPKMKDEFQQRRGYDLTRYLPAMSGHVIDNPEASDRFLWDLRRTIADLFAEKYYGHFAELAHAHGLKASIEPYTGPFESLQSGKPADIVMGEFWTGGAYSSSVKLAASVAHIYGKSLVGAESFTSAPPAHGRWQEDPYSLKALGDFRYTEGITRFIFHRYAMQPWLDKFPGMTMGQWGFHFDRTNTWFEQSTSWLKYVARCQDLLQQGRFIADVAYFDGESAPVETKASDPPLPKGFDYDSVNADVLSRAKVQDGRIVLESGMSYAVLVLPRTDRMTPQFLSKIRDLVKDGATVIGVKPRRSPSLQDYPKCDEAVRTMAEEVWGNCDGKAATEHVFGKGRVIDGQSLAEVLAAESIKPDFEVPADSRAKLVYIHRLIGDDDVYFVSNQRDAFSQAKAIFRVTGKTPQLWHADSGLIEPAPVYTDTDGRTTLDLQFEPSGSVFVVFRKGTPSGDHVVEITSTGTTQAPAPKVTIDHAVYGATDGSGSFDVTNELRTMVQSGMDTIDVSNKTFGKDPSLNHGKQLTADVTIDGKPQKKTAKEGEQFELTKVSDTRQPPAYELATASSGQLEMLPSRAGAYDVKMSSGKTAHVDASNVPAAMTIAGPWEVRFPPKWGAPEKITLDKLISWTDSADNGVKYFSGTATYVKDFDISSDMLGADRSVYLDLGKIKNLAQVKLNGKDLGILWKPPFRADITSAAVAGKNSLEVSITNLWPNRLIGDEKLGLDAEWNGLKLVRWPQWLLDGKPSPSGRFTFTTWHHWTADMQPLESGLLGPVTVQSVQHIKVQ